MPCRPSWLSVEEAGGGGGAEGYCDARRLLGELPGAQAKLREVIWRRCGGGGILTTLAAAVEEAEDGAGAGGCGRDRAVLDQSPGGPTKV